MNLLRIVVLSAMALPTWLAATSPATGEVPRKPNVLLILTDDQGYGDLGLHGNPHLKTPNLDKLGQAGVRFERFYVNSFCAPTRAALLTGRYPLRCGVWGVTHNKEAMRPDEVTIAEALRAAGYRTACIGKWHNGEQFPYTPPGQGFDEFFGFHNGHINNYFNTELIRGAQPTPTRGFITDVLTDEAIRFIEASQSRPFFCYVSYNAPHSPYQVPDRYFDKFKKRGFDERVSGFYGMCENIDDNVGRLLDLLDSRGLARDTIVLFLTDNGGTAGVRIFNAGMRGGKTSVHEGGCRVPLFIRWPGKLPEQKVVRQIVSHIDLYPTLLDLCGVARPDGPPIDGISLRPLLEGRDSDWPDRVLFTHNPISETNRYPGAVRTQQYRLVREIRGSGGGSRAKPNDESARPWQLYDMQADPGETRNLAAEQPDLVARLSKQYEEWYDDISSQELQRCPIPVGYAEENPVTLNAPQAYWSGSLRFFSGPGYAHDWLTDWTDTTSKVWFEIDVVEAGDYDVALQYGCAAADAGSKIRVTAATASLNATVAAAEAPMIPLPHRDEAGRGRYLNRRWATLELGRLTLPAGTATLTIEALSCPGGRVMDLKGVVLNRVGNEPPLLSQVAREAERPAEAPGLSAVCFSSRWIHPRNAADPWDTFEIAEAFHATDFVWTYSLDGQAVGRMKQFGGKVFLAINSLVPDEPGGSERLQGRIVDLDGNRVTAPWMRGWKERYWGCANSPQYRSSYVAYAKRAVDAGTDGLQMDDPPMNVAALRWGGCFCPHCMAGFREYLKSRTTDDDLTNWGIESLNGFNYRAYLKARKAPVGDAFAKYDGGPLKTRFAAFQESSVRAFYREARSAIDAHAGRRVVFSSNNYAGRWQFPYDLFEMGMAELPERDATPGTLYERLSEARQRGKAQLFTFVPKAVDNSEVAQTRRVIAMCYACGGHLIVPWDVYTGSNSPRYYGKPEQYADLYKFVRDHSQRIDGYEDAAFLLPGLKDERYPTSPPVSLCSAADVAVIARAVPGKPEAPVVIHLVDWREKPQPVTMTLRSRRFDPDGLLQAELLRPGSPAARLDCRTTDTHTSMEIPPLDPWGVVVVNPASGK